jgi:sigma-B regulation protein RsbU (phosphoserine phosphatase)
MTGDGGFATALCGTLDLGSGRLRLSSAGGPKPLLFGTDGREQVVDLTGLPMGLLEQHEYDLMECSLQPGDRMLLFSDGLVEITNSDAQPLDTDGVLGLLKEMNFPATDLDYSEMERRLLVYSDGIRFADDLTLVEVTRLLG